MILTLIGYRATGKTTLARLLAERLGWDWIDADVEIERRAGKSIARIFAEQGEPAFRDLEAGIIPSGRTGGSGGRRRRAVAVGESPGDAQGREGGVAVGPARDHFGADVERRHDDDPPARSYRQKPA